jgi:hypothetical protein
LDHWCLDQWCGGHGRRRDGRWRRGGFLHDRFGSLRGRRNDLVVEAGLGRAIAVVAIAVGRTTLIIVADVVVVVVTEIG